MLTEKPPVSLEVGGKSYGIDADFRCWIDYWRVLKADELTAYERCNVALFNVYGEIPENFEEAFERALWFYRCGQPETGAAPPKERLLDWDGDAACVWADFYIYAKIDLRETSYMHWWDFMAIFGSLPKHSGIKERISVRSIDLEAIKDDALRRDYAEMKRAVALNGDAEGWIDFYERIGR